MNPATLRRERTTVWIKNHRCNAHLNPSCRYTTDEHTPKDISLLPDWYLEDNICELCIERYGRWMEGMKGPHGDCERCGAAEAVTKRAEAKLCRDCNTQVLLNR